MQPRKSAGANSSAARPSRRFETSWLASSVSLCDLGSDYTSRIRADLVGLDPDVSNAITDMVVAWMAEGPPREHGRVVAELTFYEAPVADRFLIGYMVDDKASCFVLLWLRRKPGAGATRPS